LTCSDVDGVTTVSLRRSLVSSGLRHPAIEQAIVQVKKGFGAFRGDTAPNQALLGYRHKTVVSCDSYVFFSNILLGSLFGTGH
jgi:hypothetical protein